MKHEPIKEEFDLSVYARDWLASPALAWSLAPYELGRRTIMRALQIDPAEQFAGYATNAFRIISTAEDETWIAGAIGAPPSFDAKRLLAWSHLEIRDIVLWNPRTNALRILGQPQHAHMLVTPDHLDTRVTVYGEGQSLFRAWADKRAQTAAAIISAKANAHVIPVEPADSDLPGVLALGELHRLAWLDLNATVLVAGPGIDAAKLNKAIFRSARLPKVEAA